MMAGFQDDYYTSPSGGASGITTKAHLGETAAGKNAVSEMTVVDELIAAMQVNDQALQRIVERLEGALKTATGSAADHSAAMPDDVPCLGGKMGVLRWLVERENALLIIAEEHIKVVERII
jgi:hypothetical protein